MATSDQHRFPIPGLEATRCIETIDAERMLEHRVSGPMEVSVMVQFVRANHQRWGRRPLLFDLTDAHLGETEFRDWLDAREELRAVADRRGGGRTALVSRESLHRGILEVFALATRTVKCPEDIRVFGDPDPARAWLAAPPTAERGSN
jgi:hypothetical protein